MAAGMVSMIRAGELVFLVHVFSFLPEEKAKAKTRAQARIAVKKTSTTFHTRRELLLVPGFMKGLVWLSHMTGDLSKVGGLPAEDLLIIDKRYNRECYSINDFDRRAINSRITCLILYRFYIRI
jgi:hypothetical protein